MSKISPSKATLTVAKTAEQLRLADDGTLEVSPDNEIVKVPVDNLEIKVGGMPWGKVTNISVHPDQLPFSFSIMGEVTESHEEMHEGKKIWVIDKMRLISTSQDTHES